MPELLLILFKINLVLLLFAAAYYTILRRLTFYTINRAFLVIGIVFSTVYPFIDLTDFFQRQQQINPKVTALVPTIDVDGLIQSKSIIDYWQIAVIIFFAGVAVMGARLMIQFVSLYRIHRSSTPGSVTNLSVRILQDTVSPFSFWQTIYVNPAMHSAKELDTILAHEQVHVKEWHTLDIILAEISVVFYWFNPGVWLMKRAIKENIEFITDAKIVKKGIDKKAYQYSLLGVGNLQASVALVNHFNLSDLKKRIKMMNTKRSSPKKLIIYALILPVLLLTTLAFTVSKKEVKKHLLPLTKALVTVNLFNEPSVEIKVPITKGKKYKLVASKANEEKIDTLDKVRYVMNTITITDDSLHLFPGLPDVVKLVRTGYFGEESKDAVKGVKVAVGAFHFNPNDSLSANRAASSVENITVALRKAGVPLSNAEEAGLNEIIVRGYNAKNGKPADSVKTVIGKSIFIMHGKPINVEDLNKIKEEDIKSVVIKYLNKTPGVLIKTKNP